MNTTAACIPDRAGNHHDAEYDGFLARVNVRFLNNCGNGSTPVFTTDATDLWGTYLKTFADPADRQHHTCNACRRFIERFGGLVTIDASGITTPAIWDADDAPEHYRPAVEAMARLVRRARVTGVFMSSDKTWGTPKTGVWRHLSATPAASMIYKGTLLTAGQAMAEKREDFKTVITALNEFPPAITEQAVTLLRTESLYRSEKVLGAAEWLNALHAARNTAHREHKANVVWLAIATAPAGFCHPRSSMIGTLLEDIAGGMSFADAAARFASKMNPLQYQRPQAAPTAGAIAAAEKVMEKLGAAGALARRFARLEEVQALWMPKPEKDVPSTGGVFGHLKPKGSAAAPDMRVPAQTMTWDKFLRTVIPTADQIEIVAPSTGSYTSLVTAVNADAPPILQWDSADKRNPVSWYFWHGGATASQFGLAARQFHKVNAITLKPSMWNGGHEHQGQGVLFIIDGAKDSRTPTACLFPEILKAEFHAVRSVIEAYSQNAQMEGAADQSAAGLMLQKGQSWDAHVRVTSGGKPLEYKLDRWD